jgi:hypothetical protein
MENFLLKILFSPKRFGLIFIVVLFSNSELFAGDITFSLKFRIETAMENWEQPVVAEITNLENFPVEGASLDFTITNKLSLDIAYNWTSDIGTVLPKSSVILKSTNSWVPEVGLYQLKYVLSSSNDINHANDTLIYDVEVLQQPEILFRFNQISFINPFQHENSTRGRVDFTIPPSETVQYFNLMGALPGSAIEPGWLVQNFPVPAFPDTQEISYWIDLDKIGVTEGMEMQYLKFDYKLGISPVFEPFFSTKMFLSEVVADYYNVAGNNPVEYNFEYTSDYPDVFWGGEFKVKTWNYRGCTVPNIDLDSSVYNPGEMPGEVGDWNSCGPASAVNSLHWLEETNDKIPDTGTSLRDKMKIFNKVSKRVNEEGLNTAGIIKGKLAFIDSLKLPIHVKWQGIPWNVDSIKSPNEKYKHVAKSKNDSVGAYATFDWLAAEIENGEDVEIKFGWYDTLDVRHGGHWVVVSGVSDVTTARGVYVKDDEYQEKAGGMRQTYLKWVTNDEGRPRLDGFEGPNNRCWVESVVSESYDSTITFTSTFSENIENTNQLNLIVYENPSSNSQPVTISFDVYKPGETKISVYEITGRLVFSEVINYDVPGNKKVEWNGNDLNGHLAGNGIYLIRVISGNQNSSVKIIRQN